MDIYGSDWHMGGFLFMDWWKFKFVEPIFDQIFLKIIWEIDLLRDKCANYWIGWWKDDKIEGYGMIKNPNGERYEGDWKNNKADGHGTYIFADGTK